ncbi:hypothetical protein ACWF2L_21445 [Streptomyces anulatus]
MWEQVTAAAQALREELEHPGGIHRTRARRIFQQLTGLTSGAAQEPALDS